MITLLSLGMLFQFSMRLHQSGRQHAPGLLKANAPHAEAFGAKLPAQARDQMEQEDKMLSIRTRGKNGIYYIRGTVTLGDKHIDVKEFSSGTSDRDAAAHLMAEHETKLRHRLMFGPAAIVAQGKIEVVPEIRTGC